MTLSASKARNCFAVCLLMLLSVGVVWAQTGGRFSGTVKDQSGATVSNAKVTLTNQATNISRTAMTDGDGNYLFPLVEVGVYSLTVEHEGFKKALQVDLTLELNQNGRVDVTMELGRTSETVQVTAELPQVDTTGAVLGKVENSKRIEDLPLVDRDTLQLGLLQAGVFAPDPDDGSGNPFSVSGQRSESLTFLLDGADNTNFLGNNIVVSPNPDAVSEFKILTNNYDAEFGRSSGGIINQVIKSGSNSVHGSAFEFLRNDVLNAKDYFIGPDQPKGVFKRNVFGATFGAPIKKDKTFIFAAYQGARRREGTTAGQLTVLTAAQRTGDFSDLCNSIGGPAGFDGAGVCQTGGTQLINPTTNNPYPFNQVPVNPISANYINKYLPLPNVGTNGFQTFSSAATDEDQGIVRVDHNLTTRDTISALYIINDFRDNLPFQISKGASTGGNVPAGSGLADTVRSQVLNLTWTHSFARGWVNEFRASANRDAANDATPTNSNTPSELGFTNVNPDDANGAAAPIMFTPGFNLGPAPGGPTVLHDMTYQYQDHVTMVHGRHEIKFGVDLRFVQNNFNFDFFNNGSFTFGNGQNATQPGGTFTGDAAADFVGGFPGNFFQFSNAIYGIRTHSQYYYGQDTIKLTKTLTVNLGVRYEYNSPQRDIHNNIIGFFGDNAQSTVFPDAPRGVLYPGDPGTPNKALVYPDRNNWAPRVGFAWDMFGNGKLVMRGGGGIFYDIEDGALNLQFGGQPPFGDALNINFLPSDVVSAPNFLADPFTSIGVQNPFPFASRGLVGTFFDPKISFAFVTDPHFRTPYSENYNFGFQYQLNKDTAIEAVYVGSLGRKLVSTIDVNPPQPAILNAQAATFGATNADCARVLAGCDPTNIDDAPHDVGQLLTNKSNGISASHELQLTVDRRYNHGLSFRAAYTLSKTTDLTSGFRGRSSTYTDPFDPSFDHGLADFDATHRFVFSGSWEIPIDRPFRNQRIMRKVTEGWQVNVITTFQSGQPLTIFSNNDNSGQGNFLDRPNLIGTQRTFNARTQRSFSADAVNCSGQTPDENNNLVGHFYFDPTAYDCQFNTPDPVTGIPPIPFGDLASYGNLGRNSLRGPGINNWDISFLKRTKLSESKSVEFRAEMFNAFNHVQFLNPDTNGFDGTFGQISQDRGPRLVQFALKFYY
jgi:Carboxypeptidase regulatory-like domain/TonB dependent receptor